MQAISRIAAIAAFASNCAYAQPAQTPDRPLTAAGASAQGAAPQRNVDPIVVAHPPVPAELAPLSEDFQAAMANSQLQTYRYNQLADQALALKKLCDTGFGPSDICPKAGAGSAQSADGSSTTGSGELPSVAEITGIRGALAAVLVLGDGRRVTVHAGSELAGGLRVASVDSDDVRVSKGSGHDTILYFGGGTEAK
jgi:type IV pilus biogenesis protein PilP